MMLTLLARATLLTTCKMGDKMNTNPEREILAITPVKIPRVGWFEGYKHEADSEPLAALPVDDDSEEWAW